MLQLHAHGVSLQKKRKKGKVKESFLHSLNKPNFLKTGRSSVLILQVSSELHSVRQTVSQFGCSTGNCSVSKRKKELMEDQEGDA